MLWEMDDASSFCQIASSLKMKLQRLLDLSFDLTNVDSTIATWLIPLATTYMYVYLSR